MLALFNTSSRKVEPFKPIKAGEVKFYACGPTVYNFAHIGNLRTYIFEDFLRRTLEHSGLKVNHVMNITDVGHLQSDADDGDDKMELAAKREAKSPWDVAKFYEKAFFVDTEKLGILKPSKICRATEHITEMIEFIQDIEKKNYTYCVDGNVYFRIDKFPSYTDLSRRNLAELQEGARVEVDLRKENPLDFVLWFSQSKFPNQIMKWLSPWGTGFPGWHIECSAMASKYLGEHIDIHCGGIDHISIHHSNEIAQSEARFGHKWVNFWLHGEFLVVQKEKMAKSAGNFLTLSSLLEQGFDPMHYRYLCFGAHYRSQLLFSFEALEGAKNAFESLRNRVLSYKHNPQKALDPKRQEELKSQFFSAIYNDLNTPLALATVWETLKDQSIGNSEKLALIKDFDTIMGLGVDNFLAPILTEKHMNMIKERETVRAAKDFLKADKMRDELLAQGISIKDTKDGTEWYLV